VLGLRLAVECEVVRRDPPRRKAWRTVGEPRLLVIGQYCISVDIEPRESGVSRVTIAIACTLPRSRRWRWLGRLLGPHYARWCVQRMAADLVRRFGRAMPALDPCARHAQPRPAGVTGCTSMMDGGARPCEAPKK
jgi:hypothetical protein